MQPSPCRGYTRAVAMTSEASPTIKHLIQLTMTAVVAGGCSDVISTSNTDEFESYDGCGEQTRADFDVADWNLTSEHMATLYANENVTWTELDDEQKCRLVCAYANGEVETYVRYYYGRDLEFDSCTLDLALEADMVTGGTLSCTGAVVETTICLGRRPLGWREDAGEGDSLAEMVRLEHASVTAFAELAGQLAELEAPAGLIERCRVSAEDEARHVDLLVGLGAVRPVEAVVCGSSGVSRLAIALHNATEGCVSETWAALLARYQAEHAEEPVVRRAFAQIAEDESQHAQLAWELHAWLCAGLSPAQVEAVEAARAEALRGLGAKAMVHALTVPAGERRRLGLPDPRTARVLAEDFGRRLVAAA